MHFHLPKPLHGWREFAGEVGIIVIGVLIALAAEQVVEKFSWRERAEEATERLRGEIGGHFNQATEVVMSQPCIDAQLEGLERSLSTSPTTPANIYSDNFFYRFAARAPSRPWSENTWASIVSEGVASHLDKDLRDNLSQLYAQVAIMRENNRATDQLGWRLNALSQPEVSDGATRGELVQEIEEVRGRFAYMRLVGNQILGRIEKMRLKPPPEGVSKFLAASGTLKFCRAHHLPLAKPEPVPVRT